MNKQNERVVVLFRAGTEILFRQLEGFETALPRKAPASLARLLPPDGPQVRMVAIAPGGLS